MKIFNQFIVLSVVLALPFSAYAQIRPTVPSTAQPAQNQQRLQLEDQLPSVSNEPLITVPDESGKTKALKGKVHFTLKDIEFDNLTKFSKEQLRSDYEPYVGKEVTLLTLDDVAAKVTARYRNAGFILSRAVVPPQRINNGVVQIRIVEGYINKVYFEGVSPNSGLLQGYASKIQNAKPLDAQTLERYLLLMQDLPGVTARAVLKPSSDAPGASDVIVTIDEKKIDGSVTFDNRGTRYLGPLQGGLTVNANNLLGLYDQTQFHGVVTPELNELKYGEITHQEQLDSEGTKASISFGYTRTHPAYTLEAFDLEGRDKYYSVAVSHPFIRSRQTNLYGTVQFDVHDSDVDFTGGQLYNDHLRVARIGGAFDTTDMFNAINKASATISQGMPWDEGSQDTMSRQFGKVDFTKFNATASRIQPIYGPVDVYVAGMGQYSHDPLLIGEQIGLGGADFNSAYDPSEVTGDSGATGRAELRYTRNGDFTLVPNYQFYGFYDIGKVWLRSTPGVDSSSTSLADTGLGVRFNAEKPLSGELEFAAPLTHGVAADGKDPYRPRVFFSLAYRY